MPRETDLAWAAGFFDGEGCSMVARRKRRTMPARAEVKLSIGQAHPRVLERFCSIVGVGTVRGPYKNKSLCEYWAWSVQGPRVHGVMKELWPYLDRVKKEQYLKCLATKKRENERR